MTTIFSEPKKSPLSGTYSFGQFPPRSDSRSSEKTLVNMADTESQEKPKNGDMEKGAETDGQLPTITTKDHITQDPYARAKTFVWMVVNTLTTVFIVSRICPRISHLESHCCLCLCFYGLIRDGQTRPTLQGNHRSRRDFDLRVTGLHQ